MTYGGALEDLVAVLGGSPAIHEQLQRWCSMCFYPASFGCCVPQDGGVIGCGLRLCDRCEIDLRGKYQGCSSEMASALDEQPKIEKDDGELLERVRADVGMLPKTGLLMRNFFETASLMEQ